MGWYQKFVLFCLVLIGGEEFNGSNLKKLSQRPLAQVIVFFIGVLLISLIVYLYFQINRLSTFNVSVLTEQVELVTSDSTTSSWAVDGVDIYSCYDEEDESLAKGFSGFILLEPSTNVVFTRLARGRLDVGMQGEAERIGQLNASNDEKLYDLPDCAYFSIDDPLGYLARGKTLNFPLTGDVDIGQGIRRHASTLNPVLLGGQVTMLAREVFTHQNYSIGPYQLEPGDVFEVEQGDASPGQGFVSLGIDPGLRLVLMVEGERGLISRYKSDDFDIRNNLWSRMYNDEGLAILLVACVALIASIRAVLRTLI